MYRGLLLQLTLTECEDYHWVNDLRRNLNPTRRRGRWVPAHVTLLPAFDASEEEYEELLDRLEQVAAEMQPFIMKSGGMLHDNHTGWVAIRLVDEDAPHRDRFQEIVQEFEDFIPGEAPDEAHISVYRDREAARNSGNNSYVEYFDEWMTTRQVRRRISRMVDEYADEAGAPLSVEVMGLELVQRGRIVESCPFGASYSDGSGEYDESDDDFQDGEGDEDEDGVEWSDDDDDWAY